MTLKNVTVLFIFFISLLNIYCQKSDVWINLDEPTTFKYNTESEMIWIWDNGNDIKIDKKNCGYYNSRFLPSIDSLKTEGNYYFEVSPENFDPRNKDEKGHFRGIIAYAMEFSEDGNTFITYDIMRPGQQAVYKKVTSLPVKIASYLKSKGIEIPNTSKSSNKMIQSPKSTIYKNPTIPTKMYLLKGNEVEVLEQKDNWLHIRYYGNKTIEGWIKKEDVGEK